MTEPVTHRRLGWVYLVGGAFGLAAAVALTLEKIATLRDPDYVPTCSINPVLSCGSVMASPQADAFGFPNPVMGVAGFAVVTALGVVLLTGYRPARWFRLAMLAGTAFGAVFVHWLIHASLYDIHALCPYCLVVWVVMIPLFWYTLLDVLGATPAGAALANVHTAVLAAWYIAVIALIAVRFWDYWVTLV